MKSVIKLGFSYYMMMHDEEYCNIIKIKKPDNRNESPQLAVSLFFSGSSVTSDRAECYFPDWNACAR